MKFIKPPLPEPQSKVTINGFWKDMFSEYVDTPFQEWSMTLAHEDVNSDIIDDLMDEIETAQLIVWEHDSDGDRPNYENLREWLKMYYTLEKK